MTCCSSVVTENGVAQQCSRIQTLHTLIFPTKNNEGPGLLLTLGAFAWSPTHSRGEEAQLSSGWILIRSELSSLNFNSSVRAKQLLAIRYPNVVIKSLCGNLGICLNYNTTAYFQSRNPVRVLSVADRDWKWMMLLKSRFSVPLSSLDYGPKIHFGHEKNWAHECT